jgi:hypothetical protein
MFLNYFILFYSVGGVLLSFGFLPKILSTDDKPKHPKASNATASTSGVDGATCSSVKLFAYSVTHNVIVHNRPQRRFIETLPCSSENKLLIALKNFFIGFYFLR